MTIWQGDIGFEKIDRLPPGLKRKDLTIARGEATGHHHTIKPGRVLVLTDGQTQYLDAEEDVICDHQEHAQVIIPSGIYRVIRQRVFDVQRGIRQVMD